MSILVYANEATSSGKRLLARIGAMPILGLTEFHRTRASLGSRLEKPCPDIPIAVLLAPTKEELFYLLSVRELFRDVRVILVLPDNDEATVSQGHEMCPRFLSYTDSDFEDVAAVLGKMIHNAAMGKGMSAQAVPPRVAKAQGTQPAL